MEFLFRWTYRLTVSLIILFIIAFLSAYYLAAQSLPKYNKKLALLGLKNELEIIRDTHNVPHIFGENNQDVFFGLGYAHAQDRLWQMATIRRRAQGRLAEVFGITSFESDQFYRRLDFYTLARTSYDGFSEFSKEILKAYARGVNARIEEVNAKSLGRGAPEMFLYDAPFSVWTPIDSIAIFKMLGIEWSDHMTQEVLYAKVLLALEDDKRVADILPDVPGKGILVPLKMGQNRAFRRNPEPYQKAFAKLEIIEWPKIDLAGASNAFAAGPNRTATGKTLLANDPHNALSAPSLWYLARLELERGGLIGASIPGLPLIISGRSDVLGWSVTASYIDDQDLIIETLKADQPEYYETTEGVKKFQSRPSIIQVRNRPPVTVMLRWSENGPILTPNRNKAFEVTPESHAIALAATALQENDSSIEAFLTLMQSQSVMEAQDALKNFHSPSLTVTLVDRSNVALQTVGLRPSRDPGHDTFGRYPSLGVKAQNKWLGFFPEHSSPQILNPLNGVVVTSNNKLTDAPFPNHGSFSWGDSQRIQRLSRLLSERKVHTQKSFIEMQLDSVSYTARTLLPLVGADLFFTEQSGAIGTQADNRRKAMSLLANWNGDMDEYSAEPLIYATWMRALQDRLIRDEIGQLADSFTHVKTLFIERVFRDVDGASIWCDIVQSAVKESCSEIARIALDDAIIWLSERYATSLSDLRWGDAHKAIHIHETLGDVPILKYFVNLEQPTGGGDHTIQRGRTKGTDPDPFLNVHAAGYRGVYDFSDPDSSIFVVSTGQSGHPLSRHYDDLGQLWRRGEYWRMSLDKSLIKSGAIGTTKLLPKPASD